MMTVEDVRAALKQECDKAKSQTAWAKAHGISAAYVSDVINGRREPAPKILEALGFERLVFYRKRT